MSIKANWINSMRGIAILGVIMVHFGERGLGIRGATIVQNGARGVQLFFIISSYLIFLSLDKNIKPNENSWVELLKWLKRKIIRLIPLYYVALISSLIVNGTGERYWLGSYDKISLCNIVLHFFFLHGFNPYYINSIIGGEWYIGTLFILYLIAPLLYKFIKNYKQALILFLISLTGCQIVITLIVKMFITSDDYIWSSYISVFSIVAEFPAILMGISLFLFFRDKTITLSKENTLLSYCLLLTSTVFMASISLGGNIKGFFYTGTWAIVFGGIIVSQFLHKSKLVCNIIFDILGRYSYGIYLFHILIISEIPLINIDDLVISWAINYLLIVIVSLLVSVLLHIIVENKFEVIIEVIRKCFRNI